VGCDTLIHDTAAGRGQLRRMQHLASDGDRRRRDLKGLKLRATRSRRAGFVGAEPSATMGFGVEKDERWRLQEGCRTASCELPGSRKNNGGQAWSFALSAVQMRSTSAIYVQLLQCWAPKLRYACAIEVSKERQASNSVREAVVLLFTRSRAKPPSCFSPDPCLLDRNRQAVNR
jgi:hypothetical protein